MDRLQFKPTLFKGQLVHTHATFSLSLHSAQTLKMFPFLAYYESCCSEHAVNLFRILISTPLDLHPEVKLLDRRIVAV